MSKEGYEAQKVSVGVNENTIVDFDLEPEEDDIVKSPSHMKGPRVIRGFPNRVGIPGPLPANPSGLVGASHANLATGLYANFIIL